MNSPWKTLKTNWMYWRFRHITRNRLRLKAWWSHRRPQGGLRQNFAVRRRYGGANTYRPRGTSSVVYTASPRRAWALLLGMVVALTALSVWATSTLINPALVSAMGTLVVVAALYLALRGI